jgi:hypothetical protein
MKTDKFSNVEFESSTRNTKQFNSFYRAFVADLKTLLGANYEVKPSKGHFYVSGFVKNLVTGKLAYFSVSDVRFYPNEWKNQVLVRTAEHEKDFTGGMNRYTHLLGIKGLADNLTK